MIAVVEKKFRLSDLVHDFGILTFFFCLDKNVLSIGKV